MKLPFSGKANVHKTIESQNGEIHILKACVIVASRKKRGKML